MQYEFFCYKKNNLHLFRIIHSQYKKHLHKQKKIKKLNPRSQSDNQFIKYLLTEGSGGTWINKSGAPAKLPT